MIIKQEKWYRILEYLMEKKLGSPLDPKMQVHHKDEDTTNNEDDNLALEPFKEHQRKHNPSKYTDMYIKCDYCGKNLFMDS